MTKTTTVKTITEDKLSKLINDNLSNLPKTGDIVKGKVLSASKSKITVDIEGFTTGIVRGREIKNLPEEYGKLKTGDEIQTMVIDLDNENGQMELSLKSALAAGAWQFIKEKEKSQEIIEVKIKGANKGGLLSNIHGIPAFLPVSQLSPENYPKVEGGDKKKIFKKLRNLIGKTLAVKIISSSAEEEKIILSEKRAREEQIKISLQKFKPGDIVEGKITKIANFGAFITFTDNLEGLIHVSEIPQDDKGQINLAADDEVKAKIIDIKGSRVFLSLKNINNE
ncbi:MAG: S1 RNA-binding domain-containing protein [Candidatus Jacksonbacteria bacterium]